MNRDENNKKTSRQRRDRSHGLPRRGRLATRLRTYFLTGLVIAAPVSITIYITWWFVDLFDTWIKPLVPAKYNPDTYLPFSLPGVGLIFALCGITLLGGLTANLFGRTILSFGEQMLDSMPIVRNVYKALKQIFETVLSQSQSSFKNVALIEYPRPGIFALVFVSTETTGEVVERAEHEEEGMMSVFLPTTPNPTSGFLLFVPRADVQILEMSVEEAAKMIISAGLVTPKRNGDAPGDADGVPQIDQDAANQILNDHRKSA